MRRCPLHFSHRRFDRLYLGRFIPTRSPPRGNRHFRRDRCGHNACFAAYPGYLTRQSDWISTVIIRVPDDPLQADGRFGCTILTWQIRKATLLFRQNSPQAPRKFMLRLAHSSVIREIIQEIPIILLACIYIFRLCKMTSSAISRMSSRSKTHTTLAIFRFGVECKCKSRYDPCL